MSEISETSYWIKFFTAAGIPPSDATDYAITFSDNRIKSDMLMDLDKEYLKEMGITILGDVIAILKQAKIASGKLRSKGTPVSRPSIKSSLSSESTPLKNSTVATRILEHYVRKEPPPSPSNASSNMSTRLGNSKRSLEDNDDSDSLHPNKKSSVFNRLGDNMVSSTTSDAPRITVTMFGKGKTKSKSLSSLRQDALDDKERKIRNSESLQYHGVLKYSAKELASRERKEKLKRIRQESMSPSVQSRLGASRKSLSSSEGLFANERKSNLKLTSKTDSSGEDGSSSSDYSSDSEEEKSYMNYISKRKSEVVQPIPSKRIIKKVVKINKKTGQIISEKKREVSSSIFRVNST